MLKISPITLFNTKHAHSTKKPSRSYRQEGNDIFVKSKDDTNAQTVSCAPILNLEYGWGGINYVVKDYYKEHTERLSKLSSGQKNLKSDYTKSGNKQKTVDDTIISDKGYTENITDSVAVLIHNDKKGALLHISPEKYQDYEDLEKLSEYINDTISDLSDNKTKQCNAWIVGGIQGKSNILVETIEGNLARHKISTSVVAYSKDEHFSKSVYFDIPNKQIIIDGGYYDSVSSFYYHYDRFNVIKH